MGEIDDLYKEEVEDIDLGFLEEMKKSGDRKGNLVRYRKNLRKSREKFEKNYEKFNAREKRQVIEVKKDASKREKFKHLVVEHFDFAFGFWERFRMRWNVRLFRLKRKVRRFSVWLFPTWIVYYWCKVRIFLRMAWRDFVEFLDFVWTAVRDWVVRISTWIWKILKVGWKGIVFVSDKILFWKKKAPEGEEGEEKKEEES